MILNFTDPFFTIYFILNIKQVYIFDDRNNRILTKIPFSEPIIEIQITREYLLVNRRTLFKNIFNLSNYNKRNGLIKILKSLKPDDGQKKSTSSLFKPSKSMESSGSSLIRWCRRDPVCRSGRMLRNSLEGSRKSFKGAKTPKNPSINFWEKITVKI